MFARNPLLTAILTNILFFALYLAFGVVAHGSLDDYFMSSVLTGAYGSEYDVHMYFVNSAYGYFLRPFYLIFPRVGWYFLFELAGTFAAFTVSSYFVIRKAGNKLGIPLTLIMLAALTPAFYFQLSFTQCATAYTAAGVLLFAIGDSEKVKKFLVAGAIFLVAGSVMRWEGVLLGMPSLCVLLALNLYTRKGFYKTSILILCLAMAALYGFHIHDKYLFSQGDYKDYAEYQGPRAFFGDGAYYDSEATKDELQERGGTSLDFDFARNWTFYDTENLSAERLQSIIEVARRNLYDPNWAKMPLAFFMVVSRALTRTNGWCWAIFCLFLLLVPNKKSNLYPWISLSIVALSMGYLLLVNRVAYHVTTGVWLYAITSGIPFLDKGGLEQNPFINGHIRAVPLAMVAFAAAFAYFAISVQSLKTQWNIIETREEDKDWKGFVDFAQEHPDDVFILSFERYKKLGTLKDKAYLSIRPGSWQNIFSFGYWNIHLPAMKQEFKKRRVTNPVKDIVNPNVYVIEDSQYPMFLDFYREHYHTELSVDTVHTFGELKLLKYRLAGSEP